MSVEFHNYCDFFCFRETMPIIFSNVPGGKPKPDVDLKELKKLLDDFGKGDADAKIEKMGDDDGDC